ncbi:hypothetical protein OAE07_05370 [Winogradskyella sp.]|jgi:hypothetical protein|nr:hypothetical protein [Winogradskyella sp.]MDC1504214.1 hypothetical protein [Winogradskyella sp.]
MKGSFKLGNIAGIGIFIYCKFLLPIAYIIFSNYRAGHDTEQIVWSIIFIVSIFFTVFRDELGDVFTAKQNIKIGLCCQSPTDISTFTVFRFKKE